jgi:hypothetical protein
MGIVLEQVEAVEIFGVSCEAGIRKEFHILLEPMHHRGADIAATNMNTLVTDANMCSVNALYCWLLF